ADRCSLRRLRPHTALHRAARRSSAVGLAGRRSREGASGGTVPGGWRRIRPHPCRGRGRGKPGDHRMSLTTEGRGVECGLWAKRGG
ncbi:hypothetical protein SRHO_G00039480, partial [Serrasalmus rhombeus]